MLGTNLAKDNPEVKNETVTKYIKGNYLNSMFFFKVRPMKLLIFSTFKNLVIRLVMIRFPQPHQKCYI